MYLHMFELITKKEQHTLLVTGCEPLRYSGQPVEQSIVFAKEINQHRSAAGNSCQSLTDLGSAREAISSCH